MTKKDLLSYALVAAISAGAGGASFFYQNKAKVQVQVSDPQPPTKYSMNEQPIGTVIPNLELTDTLQKKSSLYDYQSDYVLINFWATWCPPCRREIPILKNLDRQNANLSVLGFSYDVDYAILEFQQKMGIDYPLFLNTPQSGMLNALFANKTASLPYTALLDKDHKIIMVHTGEITEQQIIAYLN